MEWYGHNEVQLWWFFEFFQPEHGEHCTQASFAPELPAMCEKGHVLLVNPGSDDTTIGRWFVEAVPTVALLPGGQASGQGDSAATTADHVWCKTSAADLAQRHFRASGIRTRVIVGACELCRGLIGFLPLVALNPISIDVGGF